jgi:hypothetical protein
MTGAFAAHATPAFNAWMEEQVAAIGAAARDALGDNLVALVLGGGYARGEGGVVEADGREWPYNDIDFTLVVERKEGDIGARLAPISRDFGQQMRIDVDFSRPLTVADIRRWPHWLMWTDLLGGHRVVVGPHDILTANAPAVLRESPPLIEATRLMLNRGAGLLWSMRIRRDLEKPHDADFVRRNVHKAVLAMGDAIIMARGCHQVRYTGRDGLLAEIAATEPGAVPPALLERYRAALAFRLRPGAAEPEAFPLAELNAAADEWVVSWLALESRRTGRGFPTAAVYTQWRGVREPGENTPARWPRNLIRNMQHRGVFSLRYPREVLFCELPHLLGPGRDDADWPQRSEAFLNLWRCFN